MAVSGISIILKILICKAFAFLLQAIEHDHIYCASLREPYAAVSGSNVLKDDENAGA